MATSPRVEELHEVTLTLVNVHWTTQQRKWGLDHDQAHTPEEWCTILARRLGQAAEETPTHGGNKSMFRRRLAQAAAICLSALDATQEEAFSILGTDTTPAAESEGGDGE